MKPTKSYIDKLLPHLSPTANYSFAKRSYPWKTYIRINSDGVFIGNKNQPFSNRVLDF